MCFGKTESCYITAHSCYTLEMYLKTPNAPGQRAFSRCTAPFFLEIRQYSCEKSLAQRKNSSLPVTLGVGRIHPRTSKREKSRGLERCDEKAGQSRGVVRAPRRSQLPAVRAVSGIYEGVPNTAKNSRRALRNEKSPPFQGKRRGSTEIVRRDSALLRDAGLGRVWAAGQHLLHLTPTQEHR